MANVTDTGYKCWCGNDNWDIQFSIPGYRLLRCTNCKTYRNDPPPIDSSDESSDFYSDYYATTNKDYGTRTKKTKSSRFWKVADKHNIKPIANGNVLDLGCGDGNLCGELKEAGWTNVVGTDLSKVRIKNAKERYPDIQFYDTILDETGIEKNHFDLVIMDNVIEHIPEPKRFIENVKEYIKPGGKLVMITPNMDSGNFKLLGERWTPELCPHAHIYLFTVPSIDKMAQEAEFEVEKSGSFNLSLTSIFNIIGRIFKAGIKGFIWKVVQESGSYYGRLIGQGEMLYNVVRKK